MGVKERRQREKESLRDEILGAARDIFIHEGYEGLSMRRVADKIEYSPTTIYLHFKDKSELVFSLCEETFAKLNHEMQSRLPKISDPLERLYAGLHLYVEFGLKNPQQYIATFMVPHDHASAEEKQRYNSPTSQGMQAFGILRQGVADCVSAGVLKDVDPSLAASSMWAGIHGITSLLISHEAFPWGDRKKVIDFLIESMIEGIRAKA
jgi:AcrR family transcriptional regulator